MAAQTVRVRGMRELDRAFKGVSKDTQKGLRAEWRVVAEPVRSLAEQLAVGNITNIGAAWARMRTGVTARSVYVAPKSNRRGGTPRPNLAGLLMTRAMEPALDANEDSVVLGIERVLDVAGARHGF